MTSSRELRIATLIVAPLLARISTLTGRSDQVLHGAAPALMILWMIMICALVLPQHRGDQSAAGRDAERRADTAPASDPVALDRRSIWAQLDVLTATGTAVMWAGTIALLAAGLTGWASLSVVGVLGLGTIYLAATWSVIVAGGGAPWRGATISRAILPEVAVEGDPLREEIRISGVKIPSGMRLFATGLALRHGTVARYALGSTASLAEVKLESELGSAPRGEHSVPPLTLWLADVLGLTRTPAVHRGAAQVTVLPRPTRVEGVQALLGPGRDDASSRPTLRQPSEGVFRIRSYVPGDDTRRIHWVRSLQMNQLVMRLPDEVPPAEPAVRLIVDSDLWGTEALSCRAPDELLDAVVRVWLAIGKALSELGVRVTLVAAAEHDGGIGVVERTMIARSPSEAMRLGARIAWQTAVPLSALMARDTVRQIVVSGRPRRVKPSPAIVWVAVPEVAWTSRELSLPKLPSLSVRLPFPSGSAENRVGRRITERRRLETVWHDRTIFSHLMCWSDWAAASGDYVARPAKGHVALAVVP